MITIPGLIDRHSRMLRRHPVVYRSPSTDASIAIPGCIDRHPGIHRSPSRDALIAIQGCCDRHPKKPSRDENDSQPGILRSPSRDASMVISRSPSRDAMITIPGCIDRHSWMHRLDTLIAILGGCESHPGVPFLRSLLIGQYSQNVTCT